MDRTTQSIQRISCYFFNITLIETFRYHKQNEQLFEGNFQRLIIVCRTIKVWRVVGW